MSLFVISDSDGSFIICFCDNIKVEFLIRYALKVHILKACIFLHFSIMNVLYSYTESLLLFAYHHSYQQHKCFT